MAPIPIFNNETDLVAKLIMPFLENLGFDASEISLETSFSIRLGKQKHTIKGRSDILCRRNGKNIFLIELKSDSLSISQQDIDQGISYSRLLDNIAPFTIISNGKETKIFDSITRKELTGTNISEQSDFWRNNCTLSTNEDLEIRHIALKNFVSFSEINLNIFCEAQVKDRMSPIAGQIDDQKAKFIEELHFQRNELHNSFSVFLEAEASVFGMVGEAGVGKTNSICSLALNCLGKHFVFFYNATLMVASPVHYIAQDLNLFFSGKIDDDLVLRKLDELGSYINRQIIVFIDGIDESMDPNFPHELSEIAYACGKLDSIKVCISCKSSTWTRFLFINDTKTHLYTELVKFHNLISELNNNPGFHLKDFSSDEASRIIPLYQRAFGFKGQLSKQLQDELRNGFFLRIFSEVYKQTEVPLKIDDIQLIWNYLEQSLQKTSIGVQAGLRTLSRIGKAMLKQEIKTLRAIRDETVKMDSLLDDLNLAMDQCLPEDLFSRNILVRSYDDNTSLVSFYYSKIRDYIICYHAYKLDKLSNQEFYGVLEDFYRNHIGYSAINFYVQSGSSANLATLSMFKKNKSLSYVNGYNDFLDNNFSKIKEEFDPHTQGEIGIILPKEVVKIDGYALFPLKSFSEQRIGYENFDMTSLKWYENPIFRRGAQTIYGSNKSLLGPNQSRVIQRNIIEQLKIIVEDGKLNEYSSDILLLEKLAAIVYFYHKDLGYNYSLKDCHLPRYDQIYPIDLNDIRNRIYKLRATYYYQKHGDNSEIVKKKVAEAVRMKVEMPKINRSGDVPPLEELSTIVEHLLSKGYQRITNHHLPYPDRELAEIKRLYENIGVIRYDETRCIQFSNEQAELYIVRFFEYLERAYRDVVEYCFPTFKERFSFYRDLPNEYFFYLHEPSAVKRGFYGSRTSLNGETRVNISYKGSFEEAFKRSEMRIIRGFTLESILHIDDAMKTMRNIRSRKLDQFCVLRNWLYRLLKEDMNRFLREEGI